MVWGIQTLKNNTDGRESDSTEKKEFSIRILRRASLIDPGLV